MADAVTSSAPDPSRSDSVADAAPSADLPASEPPAGTGRTPARTGAVGLVVAALGVVFGDIGTSPLYSLQTVFSLDHNKVQATPGDVYGVISLVFWSVTLIVSVKYVSIVMRADNHGEGGVLALAALVRRMAGARSPVTKRVILLAIVGASLFYGDSVITPAISVLSAVEGLKVAAPDLAHLVVPIAVTILAALFVTQRFGTSRIGALFGPVMTLWFAVLALAGIPELVRAPAILRGLSPTYAAEFLAEHPFIAFVALGAVVLCITGAEALYADMGHFGRAPIRRAWFFLVFPALTLNYLGQGALILRDPAGISSPFFLLFPGWSRIPMVVLATLATVIASQAVISGAFSVSRQAVQLGLLPPLRIRQTSEHEAGQVYLPAVNWALFAGVLVLILAFRTSERLATAYGIAVTGALLVDTVLLLVVARRRWHWHTWQLALAAVAFGGVELTFFGANLTKVLSGGWLPLLIAASVFLVMTTWRKGREITVQNRTAAEGSLEQFIEKVRRHKITRVPGTGVFPHPNKQTTPLALRANLEHNHVLHEHVVIISARPEGVPHVEPEDMLRFDDLGYTDDGIVHLTVRYGFFDTPDLPAAVARAVSDGLISPEIDAAEASYFLSRGALRRTDAPGMSRWGKALFVVLAHNAGDPAEFFGLPRNRTVVMGSDVNV
ncbi:MAG TPA: potassium transporter Kup [Mycobacteriales bacterium]|nr:potassium transporter Kup [Mycobacteriales bacterium]